MAGELIFPGNQQTGTSSPLHAPVNHDRSMFLSEVNSSGLPVSPQDGLTSMPLPLFPNPNLPPVPAKNQKNVERVADWHHPFHPRAELINAGIGAMAVRNCRIQWAMYRDHHHLYHSAYNGPVLPRTTDEQFHTVVLAAAGYIPEQAITFKNRKPQIVSMDAMARARLWSSGQLQVGQEAAVKEFLIDYALKQDFSGVNNKLIDEFLYTNKKQRRKELGTYLLSLAAYEAARPIEDTYKLARTAALLPVSRARTAGSLYLRV